MKISGLSTTAPRSVSVAPTSSAQSTAPSKCAYSIEDFCASVGGITRQHFHALIKRGKGPRFFKLGRRTLISHEAAMEWIERMERETAEEHFA